MYIQSDTQKRIKLKGGWHKELHGDIGSMIRFTNDSHISINAHTIDDV